ncbi:hypothetical protein Patl1_21960 [Pistacia atlantica]|uniref:Uncharacterized protein n=1 Tax=Pistacia atlantica TaxID=434234 RepID=A0ACC1BIJ8_9ROSI|nr:hypothetical protein Patl1_21960 [Pistacia atlantica]
MECLLELSYGLQDFRDAIEIGPLLVLGEYGTADGKFSASYSTGKLHDVAEAYSNDETVKDFRDAIEIGPLLVLGEYGAADGKFSASYSTGKLHDVAEAYSNDETVKGFGTLLRGNGLWLYGFVFSAMHKLLEIAVIMVYQ